MKERNSFNVIKAIEGLAMLPLFSCWKQYYVINDSVDKLYTGIHADVIDPLHKWRLNLNNNTWYILSLAFMFQDKGIFK